MLHSSSLSQAAIAFLGVAFLGGCLRLKAQESNLAAGNTKPSGPASLGLLPAKQTGQVSPKGTTPVSRLGQLRVQGAQLVGANGEPAALHGQGFGWDNWWPQYYNAEVVRWLRDDWNVDIVRPAMGIEPDGAYLGSPLVSKMRIETVVEAAIDAGLYVIIDWHAHNLHTKEAVAFFGEMAKKYGDKPNVLYEIFNEPEQDETWPQVKEYATAVIGEIRKYDPDNLVIVGCPEWDQRIDLVAASPLKGFSNVLYSVHFYAATHGDWLRERTQAAINAGIPVMVTESSGSQASGQGKNNYTEWNAWIEFMDRNRISWLNYSVSDKAGETISVLRPQANATGKWTDSELTESGVQVRQLLRSYGK